MFFELIESDGILDHLDDATIRAHREYLIGRQSERQILKFENVIKLIDKLKGKLFLFQVVFGLDDQMN